MYDWGAVVGIIALHDGVHVVAHEYGKKNIFATYLDFSSVWSYTYWSSNSNNNYINQTLNESRVEKP